MPPPVTVPWRLMLWRLLVWDEGECSIRGCVGIAFGLLFGFLALVFVVAGGGGGGGG